MSFSKFSFGTLLFSALVGSSFAAPARDAQVEAQIDALLSRMTLAEKVGQMCQYVGIEHLKENMQRRGKVAANNDAIGMYPSLTFAEIEARVKRGEIGSFLHVVTAEEANRLQALAKESRLGIPLLMGIDAIHGNAMVRGTTVYPAPISMAATFDEALVERLSRETALEMRAHGAQWAFSPNLDVARDGRWGRVGETFGEDPLLVSRLGCAMTRGLEGLDRASNERAIACIKHLLGGSQSINGLNGAPTDISERTIRTVFLPPYLDAIQAGAGSLMTAHNELNGVPCHANHWLIEELMRREGGFDGFVVSDWLDIYRIASVHGTAKDRKEACYQAIMAGLDMNMHGPEFYDDTMALVQEGRLPQARIDESVRRILRAKFRVGLFSSAQTDPAAAARVTRAAAHQATALEAARKSIVLLKNSRNTLPLLPASAAKILVTGPLADTPAMLGDWVLPQPEENVITPLEGIRAAAPAGVTVDYFDSGRSAKKVEPAAIAEAAKRAAAADLVILVVGDNDLRYDEADKTGGENIDRSDIELPGNQLALVKAVAAAGKPVVTVVVSGRPIGSEWTLNNSAAYLAAFEPGEKGGQALGEILFGQVNPSGRLPVTIPRHSGQIQLYYNHLPSNFFHRYVGTSSDPLFWFGAGLSYTTYHYSNLRVTAPTAAGQPVRVQVEVANTGGMAGEEVVLVYMRDLVSSTTTPVKELKAFRRVPLAPGQRQTVEFEVPYEHLSLLDVSLKRVVEPGEFLVWVGDQAAKFTLK